MRWLIVPASVLVAILLLWPSALLFRISLNSYSAAELMQEAFTWANYAQVFSDGYYVSTLLNTLGLSLLCTVLALAMGFPAAYWLARSESRFKSLWTVLTLFPLLIGGVVRTAGWMALVNTDGALNAALQALGLVRQPLQMLYTPGMVVVGILALALPYMILTLSAAIENIPRALEEAAVNLGAGPWATFRRVLLPMAAPGVAASSVLVFIMCMNAYSTPRLLGGPQFRMMSPAIYEQFVRGRNWPLGAALAFVLLGTTALLVLAGSWLVVRRQRMNAAA